MTKIILAFILLAMAAYLYRLYRIECTKTKENRAHLLDDCIALLDNPKLTQTGVEYPKLEGQFGGYQLSLILIADTLAVRKIPPLWLMVTVHGKHAINGSLDLIVRPQSNEFYSPAWQWDGNLQAPKDWPAHALIKYQETPADVDVLSRFIPTLFSDEYMKELLVLPNIVRLTYMAKQAERGEYMLMRNSVFDATPIAKVLVEKIIRKAIDIRIALELEKI